MQNTIDHLPALGVGLAFREPYLTDLFLSDGAADFLEITADHYLDCSPEKWEELELLREHYTLIPHGLHLSLGSAEGIDEDYLGKLAELINFLQPPWWSEHIAFTRAGGIEIGHLAPLPFTHEAIDAFCLNVERTKKLIPQPLILENITFMIKLPGAEMSESDFIREILCRTGCGLLLDVANLWTNSVNHEFDPMEFLQGIPLEKAVQLHFAGGHQHDEWIIDSHSEPASPEIWELLDNVLAKAPARGVILERDENLPPFAELKAELGRARDIGQRYRRWN